MAATAKLTVRLRMYDLEEVRPHLLRWEQAIETEAVALERQLSLQQTCGWPLISDPRHFRVVAVPKYQGVDGCQEHFYTSVIIASRKQSKWTNKAQLLADVASPTKKWRLAINHTRSCTGNLLLGAFLGPLAYTSKVGQEIYTGSHLASAEAVAADAADLAAIDCVTWSLMRPELTDQLRVIGLAPIGVVPGLPYVVNSDATTEEIACIGEAIRRCLTDESLKATRQALRISGFEFDTSRIDLMAYETAIKYLLTHYVVLPNHLPLARPLLCQPTMQEDADNILMAFRALQRFTALDSSHFDQKFVYYDKQPVFRLHFPARQRPKLPTSDDDLGCVAFFGQRPKLYELEPNEDHLWYERCWVADEAIVDALDPAVVTAYITGTVQPEGGDSFNLVVLQPGCSAQDFSLEVHREAAEVIAPHYYRRVRIHQLKLTTASTVKVKFLQTLVKEFSMGQTSFRGVFTHPLR